MPVHSNNSKGCCGQSTIELLCGLIVLIPVIMVLVDICVVYSAVSLNDSICKDAARIAASGDPTSATEITNRATQVIQQVYKPGGYIVMNPKPITAQVDPAFPLVPPDPVSGGSYGGNILVQTEVTVNLPAYIPGITPQSVKFDSKQSFPITFVAQPGAAPL